MGTVAKALNLLDHFSVDRPAIGLSDFARMAGRDKATTHRMLTELAEAGFVQQDSDSRQYSLGPAILRLAAIREKTTTTLSSARPVVEALAEKTGETAHLSLVDGDALMTALVVPGRAHSTRVYLDEGERIPFHATASGVVTLGFSPAERVAGALAAPLTRHTAETETDPAALRAVIAAARETGFGESVGGYEAEVHGLAAPLFDPAGAAVGAVAVATPAARMTAALADTIRAALAAAAREITWRWGGAPPADLADIWARDAR